MDAEEQTGKGDAGGMHKRRIAMPDGRYLIFYTFDEAGRPAEEPAPPEPEVKPEMTGERRV